MIVIMITLHGHLYQHRHHDRQDCHVFCHYVGDDNDGRDHKKWCRYLAPFRLEKLVGICFRGWAELSGKDIHYSNSNP